MYSWIQHCHGLLIHKHKIILINLWLFSSMQLHWTRDKSFLDSWWKGIMTKYHKIILYNNFWDEHFEIEVI